WLGDVVHVGAFDPDGARWFDLGALDVPALLAQGALRSDDLRARIRAARPIGPPQRFDVPVARPGKILCLARNYGPHARELAHATPSEPLFFAKLPDTLLPHGAPVRIPHWLDSRVDHEAELGLVLGFADAEQRGARYVPPERAAALVAGFTPLND